MVLATLLVSGMVLIGIKLIDIKFQEQKAIRQKIHIDGDK